jgi:hypothetical protein
MENLGKDDPSTTCSTFGARIDFVLDQKGQVDHAIFRIVEGDLKGVRK